MKSLQELYDHLKDIPWNFLIGDDGFVYEGRGYYFQGEIPSNKSLTNSFDDVGLIIAFIGTFTIVQPSLKQIGTFNAFLENSVRRDFLEEDYVLLLQDELVITELPSANGLAEVIKAPGAQEKYHESVLSSILKELCSKLFRFQCKKLFQERIGRR